jgi:hypothetical protein
LSAKYSKQVLRNPLEDFLLVSINFYFDFVINAYVLDMNLKKYLNAQLKYFVNSKEKNDSLILYEFIFKINQYLFKAENYLFKNCNTLILIHFIKIILDCSLCCCAKLFVP